MVINQQAQEHKPTVKRSFLKEKNGDSTLNWILSAVIGIAAAAILIGLITGALPTIWDSLVDKITAFMN